MTVNSSEEDESGESQELLSKSKAPKSGLAAVDFKNLKWTRKDVHLTVLMTLITFGDAVEIYLPGVITQAASSEMGVSHSQEGLLGIILYLCLALSFFVLPVIKNKMGRKTALLVSLYTSILATVFCSLVPNYWTLVLSRASLGLCIGLNWSVGGLYFAEEISNYDMYNIGGVTRAFAFTFGGGWVAVLGYLLLERVGWRYFILCTSLPIFLLPICMLHFGLKREEKTEEIEGRTDKEVIVVRGFLGRLIRGCIVNFINMLQGWGSILLIPALLTYLNKEEPNLRLTTDQELLILALLYGGAKLVGRILSVFLLKYVRFRVLEPLLSAIIASCYLTLILESNSLFVTVVAMGIANMCFCVTRCELTLMEFDKHYFGTERLVLAAGIMAGCAMLGAAVGAVVASFLSSHHAVIFTFVLSCIQVVTFSCISER